MAYDGPGIYKHYKGNFYKVIGIAAEEASLVPVVVYEPLDRKLNFKAEQSDITMWTRPLDDFNAMVRDASIDHSEDQFKKPDKLPPMDDPRKPQPRFRKLSFDEIAEEYNKRRTAWARYELQRLIDNDRD